MSFEVKNLNLVSIMELPSAQPLILDRDFVGEVTIGFDAKNHTNFRKSVPGLEALLAERLGVERDDNGTFPGVIDNSSVLGSLVKAYAKACTTKEEILIAGLNLKDEEVDAEFLLPLRAQFLQHSAAVHAVKYSVAPRSPKGKKERLHLVRTSLPKANKIKPNPFYVRPSQLPHVSGSVFSTKATRNAINRGTVGTT